MRTNGNKFGKKLKELRLGKSLSQVEFAKLLNVSQQTLSSWEIGKVILKSDQMVEIERTLNSNFSSLHQESATHSVGAMQAIDTPFPLYDLSPVSFERFTQLLVEYQYEILYQDMDIDVSLFGKSGHNQYGVDVIADFSDGRRHTFQCKRYKKSFGPNKIQDTVKQQTEQAERKVLVLSRVASADARNEIAKYSEWKLWDQEDISKMIRNFPLQKQKNIVRIFFPGLDQKLLGQSADSPWESLESFFSPFSDTESTFHHQWKLVGRKSEYDDLLEHLEKPDFNSAIVSGRGGTGKSRLIKEIISTYIESHRTTGVYFLARDYEFSKRYLEDLGSGDLLIVIEDAHDRDELDSLFEFVHRNQNRVKLLISTRLFGLKQLEIQLHKHKLYKNFVCQLEDLSLTDTEKLISQVAESQNERIKSKFVTMLARITQDSPLVAVISTKIILENKIDISLINNESKFRNEIVPKFQEILTGKIGKLEERQNIHKIIQFTALMQPISVEDSSIWNSFNNFFNIDILIPECNRLVDIIVKAGIFIKRGNKFRISPEVLADYLIENLCIDSNGYSNGYIERAYDCIFDSHLENFLLNVARLDWRRNKHVTDDSLLLQKIWAKLGSKSKFRYVELNAVSRIAFFQPFHAMNLVNQLHVSGNDNSILAEICKEAAYSEQHIDKVLKILWELAKCNGKGSIQNTPMEYLKEITRFRPYKSLTVTEEAISFGLELLKEIDSFQTLISPLDFLSAVFETQGDTIESEKFQINLIPYINHPDKVEPLRKRVISILIELLASKDPYCAVRSAQCLESALRYPYSRYGFEISDITRNKWTKQFIGTLRQLILKLDKNQVHPLACISIYDTLVWFSKNNESSLKKLSIEALELIYRLKEFKIYLALTGEYGLDLLTNRYDKRDFWNSLTENVAMELRKIYSDPKKLLIYLEKKLSEFTRAQYQSYLGINLLIQEIAGLYPKFNHILVEHVLLNRKSTIKNCSYISLSMLYKSDNIKYREYVNLYIKSKDVSLCCNVSRAIWEIYSLEYNQEFEISVLKRFLMCSEPIVIECALNVVKFISDIDHSVGKMLVLSTEIINGEIAEGVLSCFGRYNGIPVESLNKKELNRLLMKLKSVPDLSGYWLLEFLTKLSSIDPIACIDFIFDCLDLENVSNNFHQCFLNHSSGTGFKFRESPKFYEFMDRYINWMKDQSLKKDVNQILACDIFVKFFGPIDNEIVNYLSEKIDNVYTEELKIMALILRKGNREFVFEFRDFVDKLVSVAQKHDTETLKKVVRELSNSAIFGSRGRNSPGTPNTVDIRLRDESIKVLKEISRYSPLYDLYNNIKETAEENIRNSKLIDEY